MWLSAGQIQDELCGILFASNGLAGAAASLRKASVLPGPRPAGQEVSPMAHKNKHGDKSSERTAQGLLPTRNDLPAEARSARPSKRTGMSRAPNLLPFTNFMTIWSMTC
jgi:hypothetical protein